MMKLSAREKRAADRAAPRGCAAFAALNEKNEETTQ
jgi:hypothetical protein